MYYYIMYCTNLVGLSKVLCKILNDSVIAISMISHPAWILASLHFSIIWFAWNMDFCTKIRFLRRATVLWHKIRQKSYKMIENWFLFKVNVSAQSASENLCQTNSAKWISKKASYIDEYQRNNKTDLLPSACT